MIFGIASPGGGRSEATIRLRIGMWLAHVAGGAIGGLLMGTLVWFLAAPLRTFSPEVLVVSLFGVWTVTFIAWDLLKFELPFSGKQVRATWIAAYGPTRSYAMYGAALGSGLATYVPIGLTYVVFAALAISPSVAIAAMAGAAFGTARTSVAGPGSLVAEPISRLLYRSGLAQRAFAKVSAVASLCILLRAASSSL